MRRFELSQGTSNKFWEVGVSGSTLLVHFGRIGTHGQTQQKDFPSSAKAEAERDKLIKEKVKKGYAEVAGGDADDAAVAAAAPPPKPKAAPAAQPAAAPAAPTPAQKAAAPVAPATKPAIPVRDSVAWTEGALREASPIRGSSAVPPRAPDGRAAFTKLHKAARAVDKLIAAGMKRPNADVPRMEAVRSYFGVNAPGAALDLDTQAAAYALLSKPVGWNDEDREEAFVRFWLAGADASFAFRAIARAAQWEVDASHDKYLTLVEPGKDPPGQERRTRGGDAWRGLRLADALATEAEHAALLELAGSLRKEVPPPVAASFAAALAQPDWCRADADTALKNPTSRGVPDWFWPLLLGLESVDDVQPLVAQASQSPWYLAQSIEKVRFDLVARFGPAAAKLLIDIVNEAGVAGVDRMRSLAEALALIVTPEVAELFVRSLGAKELRAIAAEYLQRHPEVSVELLASAATHKGAGAEAAKAVLKPIVAANPGLLAKVKPALPPAAQAVIAAIEEQTRTREEAKPEELPRVLREPPWLAKRTLAPQKVVAPLETIALEESVRWKPGEEAEKRNDEGWQAEKPEHAEANVKRIRALSAGEPPPDERSWNKANAAILAQLPRKELLAVLPYVEPSRFNWSYYGPMETLVARHGLAVLDLALRFAREVDGVAGAEALLRVCSPRVAPLMADALVRLKRAKAFASEWLLDFPEAAAAGLIPDAVGKPGKARDAAETALRFLSSRGHRETIEKAARKYGAEAADAVAEVLDFDALFTFPAKLPKMPAFWNAGAMTRPLLRGGEKALPLAAMNALGTMLSFSSIDDPYPGIADVKEACDPRSLADFAWDLFQSWLVAGASSKEQWAFLSLAYFGDDDCARKLTPMVRAWPGEAAHARAVVGLDVLARIGTDVALMHLHGIAQKLKFKGLQEKAREKIDQIAEARGLTAEELADRLVPDLGLDDDGSLSLDFGPRTFRVVFDESLKPGVTDESGKRLPDLPKPKQSDEAEKAKAATDTWKALKKDAKTIATGQILRLEIAMCTQRRWEADVFRPFLLEHPLMVHLVRRLVWGVYGPKGELVTTFRVAEDRSLADVKDDAYELPDGARAGIVHRLELDDAQAAAWGQVFADYEILQPFIQLAREVATPTAEEKKSKKLEGVVGLTIPTGKVLGLDHRGWRRGPPQDGGVVCWYEKPLGGELVACLDLDPGIFTGIISESPEQKLGEVTVSKGSYHWQADQNLAFGALTPIAFSELLRDLESLRA